MIDKTLDKINKIVPQKWQWILSHEGFRKYFKNTGWMFFGQMFSLLTSFFIGAWLARYLGPENYGVISYVLAFAGLFSFISSLGVDGILSRELIAVPENKNKLLGTSFVLKLIGGFIAFFIAGMVVCILESSIIIKGLVLLFSCVYILQSFYVISIFFQSKVDAKRNVRPQIIATLISSILKLLLIYFGLGIIWLILIYVLDSLWISAFLITEYKNSGHSIKQWKFDYSLAKKILSSSWFLMLSSASVYIYMKVDQVMIGIFMGNFEVGLYAAAVKFVEIWYFIPSLICASLFPAIINAKKYNAEVYKKRLKSLYLLMIILAIVIAVPSTLLAHRAILLLFGAEYLMAVGILQIYIWSGIGLFLGWAINQYLLSEYKIKTIFYYNLLAMIINVIFNLILIPLFGLSGAAWSTLFAYSVIPLLFFISKKF